MDNEKDIIDYGKWTVPCKWEEVTLKQFQDIERYYDDKDRKFDVREVLHIFTNHTEDDINSLPVEFVEEIMSKLLFLQKKPDDKEPSNKIVIDGEAYTIHFENKLKVGEYVGADTAMKGDKHNYAAILAILCRKEDEIYDSKFENEVLEDRIKFWEKQSVVSIFPLIGFFFKLYITSTLPTQLYSQVMEAIDHTRRDIETSAKNGEVSRRYTKSAMKKLRKLEKSINFI